METKIDRRIGYKLVLDTETCPVNKEIVEVDPRNMWVYDIGWSVIDKRDKHYVNRSFLIWEIFCNEKELMKSAYYAEKIPKYWEEVKSGKRQLVKFYTARQILLEDIQKYGVNQIFAHNMYFDCTSLNNTLRYLTKSKYYYFFPRGIEICDTLKMARDVIGKMPTYIRFCENHGFCTSNGKPRFTAEVLYRYITKDVNFIESHTALEDVMIESTILAYCYKQHKKMRKECFKKK